MIFKLVTPFGPIPAFAAREAWLLAALKLDVPSEVVTVLVGGAALLALVLTAFLQQWPSTCPTMPFDKPHCQTLYTL